MILRRSRGLTTVREVAPAMPPAMKYDVICGLRKAVICFLSVFTDGGSLEVLVVFDEDNGEECACATTTGGEDGSDEVMTSVCVGCGMFET